MTFEGSMVALITPMEDGSVDEKRLRDLVRFQEEAGTDVLVPCGTTGESATLTYEEHERVIEIVVDEAESSRVLAGSGSNSTHEAIRLTQHAKDVGCDGALVITPYYNKPPQRGMVAHFRRIAEEVDLPQVLYNVPSRTGINLEAETVASLADLPNIVGIKEASGDVDQAAAIVRRTPDDFSVLSGDDALTLPLLAVGGVGGISVAANVVPARVKSLIDAFRLGDQEVARKTHLDLQPLFDVIFVETNPIPVKEAAAMMGLCQPDIRSPLSRLAEEHRGRLRSVLDDLGVDVS